MDRPHCAYLFIHQWTLELFPPFGKYESCCFYEHKCTNICWESLLSNLRDLYPEVGLHDPMVIPGDWVSWLALPPQFCKSPTTLSSVLCITQRQKIFSRLNYYDYDNDKYLKTEMSASINYKGGFVETSLVVQWLRIHLPVQETQVWFLVAEPRSHMLWSN